MLLLDINQIKETLPHRYPFLLIDRVIEVEKGKRAVGIKNITASDYYCQQQYFNGDCLIPGSLQVEIMAQIAAFVVLELVEDKNSVPLFAALEKARFRRAVQPGDQLRVEVELLKYKAKTGKFMGKVFIDDELVSEAQFTCMAVPQI
jgi:3-hydroxymyristoyl/3-hydroxydecanoyl-(acyl carrier protein) dehydratases